MMTALAVVSLSIPAVFAPGRDEPRPSDQNISFLSDRPAVTLMVVCAVYILSSLRQESPEADLHSELGATTMLLPVALGLVAATTIGIVLMSELPVGAVDSVAEQRGLSELFIGVILVPLVKNIAEHIVAVLVAYPNKMDLSLDIGKESGLQIALFFTPMLVPIRVLLDNPLTLAFNSYELAG
jgi:Ca2+:H+ antiporter